ncbi:Crp/Fnr family transcriptional regulator [Thalassobaculum litoreum]|uniref:Cyclic nucleotide-binding domain-containing protein n=1 Tax=Thalassobaculum litoreum DSM 18839 TaxID=1123362 RepID=A0A8G2BEY5_9PROT|nr:cyclic nucleotide-binding domain-containing protein [Thalassobaculum litoreum]SDF17041.1 Cyclic nucleotide-binding domain-containing protein [Thalassobaculum litoreum DSM 18839]
MGTRSGDGLTVSKYYFDPNEPLFEQGNAATSLFLIEDGTVEIYQTAGARTVSLARLGPGEVVGELALIDGATHTRGARAISPVIALEVAPDQLEAVLDESHTLVRLLLKHVVRKLDRTTDIAFGQPRTEEPGEPAASQGVGEILG